MPERPTDSRMADLNLPHTQPEVVAGRVSVVISSYNHAPYIESSILSVLQQTYPDIELIVVDDGSTDDSVAIIRRLACQYDFDFSVQTNKGLTRTLNEAFARCTGEYLAPFGSDDIMLPERLQVQISYMQDKPEVGMCCGNIELIDAAGNPYDPADKGIEAPFKRISFDDLFIHRKSGLSAPTMLIRREAFERAGGFNPEIRLEDLYIQLKILSLGYYIDKLPVLMARYRKHPTNSYKNIRFMTESILRIYQDYAEHPAYESVRLKFINSMLSKASRKDKQLARELLSKLPLSAWNARTLKSVLRLGSIKSNHA